MSKRLRKNRANNYEQMAFTIKKEKKQTNAHEKADYFLNNTA